MTAKSKTSTKKLPVPLPNHPELSATESAIPAFLDRKLNGIKGPGPAVVLTLPVTSAPMSLPEAAKLREEQKQVKKTKAAVRIEKLKAKQAGATKAMPLTGKAALQAIVADAVKNGKKITRVPSARETAKRTAEIDKAARKGTPVKKPAAAKTKARGIGDVAKDAILAGKTNDQALAAVMKAFPKCSSNLACMSWYRGKLRKEGKL